VIKPPSLVSDYSFIYSGDPALLLPEDPEQRKHALEVARETGNWLSLLGPGDPPTVFTLRPLSGSVYDWWLGEVTRQRLVNAEAASLIVRLALVKVDNFGAHKVERVKVDGIWLAKVDIIDAIYSEAGGAGRAVIDELASEIIDRATKAPRPKS
jgi:hypothetical protein